VGERRQCPRCSQDSKAKRKWQLALSRSLSFTLIYIFSPDSMPSLIFSLSRLRARRTFRYANEREAAKKREQGGAGEGGKVAPADDCFARPILFFIFPTFICLGFLKM
jgi:hypothetical protein